MAFLERNANRGSISTDYDIDYSIKMESYYNAENLTRTPSSAGNQKNMDLEYVDVTEPSHSLGQSNSILQEVTMVVLILELMLDK